MTETTTEVLKRGTPDRLEREYQALSPEDRETVDKISNFYEKLAKDHDLGDKITEIITDLAKINTIEWIKEGIADKAAE